MLGSQNTISTKAGLLALTFACHALVLLLNSKRKKKKKKGSLSVRQSAETFNVYETFKCLSCLNLTSLNNHKFFFGHPMAYGVPRARDQIRGTAVTYTTAMATLAPLSHCARQELNVHPGAAEMLLIPLHHSGNSNHHQFYC